MKSKTIVKSPRVNPRNLDNGSCFKESEDSATVWMVGTHKSTKERIGIRLNDGSSIPLENFTNVVELKQTKSAEFRIVTRQ